jgi:hypothetical protein
MRGEYPCVCLYPVLIHPELEKIEQRYGPMSHSEFELIGSTAMTVYRELGRRLQPHGIWYRALNHPTPPPTVDQHARFSFGISTQSENAWSGTTTCNISSHVRDGRAVLDDLLMATATGLAEAHAIAGINRQPERQEFAYVVPPEGQVVREGLYLTGVAVRAWRLHRPSGV